MGYEEVQDKGILNKYEIAHTDGTPVDEGAEYFVLRLDDGATDKVHLAACRKAVLVYAEEVKDHLPVLSAELKVKYSPKDVGVVETVVMSGESAEELRRKQAEYDAQQENIIKPNRE